MDTSLLWSASIFTPNDYNNKLFHSYNKVKTTDLCTIGYLISLVFIEMYTKLLFQYFS